ncbi:unnamed protein product [Mytilus coruscus]|uniref:Uncharacterized protein n=1 Tax=Mytilus coruscus TaxID=42192 RepID=A0A6J8AWY6_MYTCO|nr:unnamed protein product [Mytilus coruscus]
MAGSSPSTQVTTNTPTTSDISTSPTKLTTKTTMVANLSSTGTTMKTNSQTTNDISTSSTELTTEATMAANSPSTDSPLTTNTPTTNDISIITLKTTTESIEGAISTVTDTTMTNKTPTTSKIYTITSDVTTVSTVATNSPSATYIQEFTDNATAGNINCMCPCANYLPSNSTLWTEEKLVKRLTLLKSTISVNKKETNMYKGTKRSAYDPRKSSRNLGLFGVIVLVLPVIFVVVIDIQRIFK